MRILGIAALATAGLSLILWLASWVMYNFLLASMGYNDILRYVAQTVSFLSSLTEYIAIVLLSIGLIVMSKR